MNYTPDPVDLDLDRELARIEAENARDEEIERRTADWLHHASALDMGEFILQHINDEDLYAALWSLVYQHVEKEVS